jgi:hypothetical protein
MPFGWVRAFQAAMPRLRAQAQLRDLAVLQLAWGVGSVEMRERMIYALTAEAEVTTSRPVVAARPSTVDLAALGVRVVEE